MQLPPDDSEVITPSRQITAVMVLRNFRVVRFSKTPPHQQQSVICKPGRAKGKGGNPNLKFAFMPTSFAHQAVPRDLLQTMCVCVCVPCLSNWRKVWQVKRHSTISRKRKKAKETRKVTSRGDTLVQLGRGLVSTGRRGQPWWRQRAPIRGGPAWRTDFTGEGNGEFERR